MYFTNTILTTLLAATTALAAPVEKSMMAEPTVPDWTIENIVRNCDAADNKCTIDFKINPKRFECTPVHFITNRNGSTSASRNSGVAQTFGNYTITSGWSGQFGDGHGFTTFAVFDSKNHLIAYPSYTDVQFANGTVVTPDQSYKPQRLA